MKLNSLGGVVAETSKEECLFQSIASNTDFIVKDELNGWHIKDDATYNFLMKELSKESN